MKFITKKYEYKMTEKLNQEQQLNKHVVIRSVEDEEIYWFIRWVKMRYERNKLQKEVNDLRNLELSKVHKENLQLKKTLEQIKEEYQPIKKKIHNGSSKRSKGYGRK